MPSIGNVERYSVALPGPDKLRATREASPTAARSDAGAREVTPFGGSIVLSETLQPERRPVVIDRDLAYRVQAIVRRKGANDIATQICGKGGGELGIGHPEDRRRRGLREHQRLAGDN